MIKPTNKRKSPGFDPGLFLFYGIVLVCYLAK